MIIKFLAADDALRKQMDEDDAWVSEMRDFSVAALVSHSLRKEKMESTPMRFGDTCSLVNSPLISRSLGCADQSADGL